MKKKLLAIMLLVNVSLVNIYTPVLSEAATFVDKQTEINASTITWGEYEFTTDGKILEYLGHCENIEIPEVITKTINGELQEIRITSIGSTAFWGCDEVTSITIPASVSSIASGAFQRCENLTTVTVSEDNSYFKSIDGVVYSKSGDSILICPPGKTEVTIENVTSIGELAFEYCKNLTNITIPSSVKTISYDAFSYCTGLTDITIPNSVTYIDTEAFQGCSNLTTITIPNSVTHIGDGAFSYCDNLTEIAIPNSVTSLGHGVFTDCKNLTSISLPASITSLSGTFHGCSSITDISFIDSVSTIGTYAFGYCDGLTNITIPDSVTHIGNSAFRYCRKLTDVIIPNSVTSINDFAFADCDNLTNVTIPKSVTCIYGNTFMNSPDSLTLHGYVGSVAETFAKEYGINFVAIPEPTSTPVPTVEPTSTPVPTVAPTSTPVPTVEPTSTPVPTVKPTSTPVPTVEPTSTPVPTAEPTSTPVPTVEPTSTPVPTAEPTSTPVPTAEPTSTPAPTAEPTSTPAPTAEPTSTPAPVKVNKITLAQTKRTMYVGEAFALTTTVSPANAANKAVTYASSNPSVATVDANGKIAAKKPGTTVITVKAKDGSDAIATCTINVGYKIVYKLNGGTNNKTNPSVYTKATNVKLAAPTKAGYTFEGWYTTKNFKSSSKITTISKKSTGTKTVYAKWKKVTKPSKATLNTVKAGKSASLTANVKKVKGAKGYQFVIATDKKFKKNVQTYTTTKTSYKFKGLKKKTTYYVKVRAYNLDSTDSKIYGSYSKVKSVTIKK